MEGRSADDCRLQYEALCKKEEEEEEDFEEDVDTYKWYASLHFLKLLQVFLK